jgi:cytochrome c6
VFAPCGRGWLAVSLRNCDANECARTSEQQMRSAGQMRSDILSPFSRSSPRAVSSNASSFTHMKKRILLPALGAVFVLSSLSGIAAPAAENWENHCTKCHGDDGKGQTKAGRKLNLKDYTDAAVQAKMTDEEIIKAITDGVTDEKGKERMKAYKDELSAEEIKELLAYVRKFKA